MLSLVLRCEIGAAGLWAWSRGRRCTPRSPDHDVGKVCSVCRENKPESDFLEEAMGSPRAQSQVQPMLGRHAITHDASRKMRAGQRI